MHGSKAAGNSTKESKAISNPEQPEGQRWLRPGVGPQPSPPCAAGTEGRVCWAPAWWGWLLGDHLCLSIPASLARLGSQDMRKGHLDRGAGLHKSQVAREESSGQQDQRKGRPRAPCCSPSPEAGVPVVWIRCQTSILVTAAVVTHFRDATSSHCAQILMSRAF